MLRWVLLLYVCVTAAAAPLLRFDPANSSTAPGGTVTVNVMLTGLPAGGPPSVGSFDLDVLYDPSVVVPVVLSFGPFLGDESLGEAINFASALSGVLDFGTVSLLTGAELDALQPDELLLGQIVFQGLTPGTSPLTFGQILIDDSDGLKLPVEGGGGSVTVVPEPATFLMVGSVLAALLSTSGRRRGHQRPKM